jgi:hypothetical protein
VHHVVDIVPEIVVVCDMLLQPTTFIKLHSDKITNEADINLIINFLSFFISHLGKSIDNDSEEYIQ